METNKILKNLRKERKLNQSQFAKLLDVKQSYISQIENNKLKLSIDSLKKYLKVFGTDLKISV